MKRLAVVAIALAGCGGDPAPAGAGALGTVGASVSASARPFAPSPAASARRPTRRYYLGRTDDRCEVYAVDDGGASPATWTPCPLDLQPGERIRIAGNTCARDSGDPARRVPVVCPDPLTNLEKRERPLVR